VGRDLAEQSLLELLARYGERKLILSPIGAQGFVLGRGNQPLNPTVIRLIGVDNMILIATPAKLARTPLLRFDTGDTALDAELISRKFLPVVIGYRRMRMVKIAG
jgi:predicted polyphosphate/ATP-dependent NAD kinase